MILTPEVKTWPEGTDRWWGMFSIRRAWESRDVRPILRIFQAEWDESVKLRPELQVPIGASIEEQANILLAQMKIGKSGTGYNEVERMARIGYNVFDFSGINPEGFNNWEKQIGGIFLAEIAAAQRLCWEEVVELTNSWIKLGTGIFLPKDVNQMSPSSIVFLHTATECDRFAGYVEKATGFPVNKVKEKIWHELEVVR